MLKGYNEVMERPKGIIVLHSLFLRLIYRNSNLYALAFPQILCLLPFLQYGEISILMPIFKNSPKKTEENVFLFS